MDDMIKEAALRFHEYPNPGKIQVAPTKPLGTQYDLSLAYSPGVAAPCMEIHADPLNAYKYTAKGNLVAVIPTAPPCSAWATSARWRANP